MHNILKIIFRVEWLSIILVDRMSLYARIGRIALKILMAALHLFFV